MIRMYLQGLLGFEELEEKKKILCVVDNKMDIVTYISDKYNIPIIKTYTDRAPLYDEESSDCFITKERLRNIPEREFLLKFEYKGDNYYSFVGDLEDRNVCLTDRDGLQRMKDLFGMKYIIKEFDVNMSSLNGLENIIEIY